MATTALDAGSPAKDCGTCSSRGSDRCCVCMCVLFMCGVKGLGLLFNVVLLWVSVLLYVTTITHYVMHVCWVRRFTVAWLVDVIKAVRSRAVYGARSCISA